MMLNFEQFERAAKVVQNLTIVFGVFAGAFALVSARFDKRIEQTMAFRKEYNDSVRKDYLAFMSKWDTHVREHDIHPDSSVEEKNRATMDFFHSTESVDRLRNISDFFYTLFVC